MDSMHVKSNVERLDPRALYEVVVNRIRQRMV